MIPRRLAVLVAAGCVYLGVMGFLAGMVVERMRFDHQRALVLQTLSAAQERLHAHLMDLERHTTTLPLIRDQHASSVP